MSQATLETAPATPVAARLRWRTRLTPARLCAWSPLVGAVLLIAYGVRAQDLPVGGAARAAVVVLVTQILPGAVVWRAVRPRRGWLLEDVAMGFAIGSALAIGAQIAAGLAHSRWLAFAPLALAAVLFAVPMTRRRVIAVRTETMPWWWSPLVSCLFVLTIPQLRNYFGQVPLTWGSGGRRVHVDAYLHLALSGQLAHRGPTTFPWVLSEDLGYHWLSHSWVAQVSVASGVALDEVLFGFMPVLMPVVVVLSVAVAAVRLTDRYWTGPIAGVIALVGGDLYVFGRPADGLPLTPLSPSLGLAAPMMVGIVVVLVTRWRRTALPGAVLVLPLLCIAAAGAKGSTVPLIVAGLVLAAAALLVFDRTRVPWLLVDLAIALASLALAVRFVFRGSGAGLHLSLGDAAGQTPGAAALGGAQTRAEAAFVLVLAALAVVSRGVGSYVLPFVRERRRDPSSWLLIGAGLAAGAAVAVFAHPGSSQYYFARSADPLLALGSVAGLVALADRLDWPQRVSMVAIGVIAGPLVASLPVVVLGRPRSYRVAATMVAIAVVVLAAAATTSS